MKTYALTALLLAATAFFGYTNTTFAQTRCDCSLKARSGQCSAAISMAGKKITVTSDTPRCSMVTWFANGEPKVTTVTDGRQTEQWLGKGSPRLQIDACQVCADRKYASAPEPNKSAASFAGTWSGTAKNAITNVRAGFVLRSQGGSITGHYFQEGETNEQVTSASVSGNTLTMRTGPISWKLTVNGNSMTGTWRNMIFSGPISVQRN